MIRLDRADNTQAGVFDQTLIGVAEDVAQNREHVADHREAVRRRIAATVGRRLEGSALNSCGEKVQVIEQRGEAALTDDRAGVLLRDLLECLRNRVSM